MKRDYFALLSRGLGALILGAFVLMAAAEAAPLGIISMEGRRVGDTDWVKTIFPALAGDVIEYRLVADMAAIGTTNGSNTINSLANSGFQSLSLAITQDPSDPVQVSFNPPASASFRNGWGDGTGASPGTLTPRPGGAGNDLTSIRPIHTPGIFSGVDPEVILSGNTFTVVQPAGFTIFTELTPTWGTASGALRINGAGQIFITGTGQSGADPVVGFSPLTLGLPEPGTIALAGIGLAGLLLFARRR